MKRVSLAEAKTIVGLKKDEKFQPIYNKDLQIGLLFYDTRFEEFIILETEHELFEYGFVAPELILILN